MIYTAHRGFRIDVAENTYHAFDLSVAMQMDFIELDVQLSKDQKVYIIHDDKVDRTMKSYGEVSQFMASELDSIKSKIGSFSPPSLEATIKKYLLDPSVKTKLMIELKGEKVTEPTCEIIKRLGVEDKVCFSGNKLSRLKKANTLCPTAPICLNITNCPDFDIDQLFETENREHLPLPFEMISLASSLIFDEEYADQCHLLGIQAFTWNFINQTPETSIEQMKKLLSFKIDGILFDDPKTVDSIRTFIKNNN
jgi:glycerophosphoryl diester phosphodiesterase